MIAEPRLGPVTGAEGDAALRRLLVDTTSVRTQAVTGLMTLGGTIALLTVVLLPVGPA